MGLGSENHDGFGFDCDGVRRYLFILLAGEGMAQTLKGNIENMIGWTKVPLGEAGPLLINQKEYYLPLATTEGALVASINRGCKATRLAGGIKVLVEEVGTTRGPVFRTSGIIESLKLKNWLDDHFNELKKEAGKTSSHLILKKLGTRFCGKDVFVRFYFDTGEAMGMNMVTIATQKIVELIEKKLEIKCLALSGNFCIDKKPAWLNFISGRGQRVWAESVIARKIVKDVLKTTPEKIIEVVRSKQWLGSMMAGSLGFNGHFANILAAIFLATGQDLAHVAEGSLGITTAEPEGKSLYFSVYLPDLMVGTVGGGTRLETQSQALKKLGVNKKILAEVIGGAVLAGELSLTAALASQDLAKAHKSLGRAK